MNGSVRYRAILDLLAGQALPVDEDQSFGGEHEQVAIDLEGCLHILAIHENRLKLLRDRVKINLAASQQTIQQPHVATPVCTP